MYIFINVLVVLNSRRRIKGKIQVKYPFRTFGIKIISLSYIDNLLDWYI